MEAVLKWKDDVTVDFLVKIVIRKELLHAIACDATGKAVYLPHRWAFPEDACEHNVVLFSLHNADLIPVSTCALSEKQLQASTNQICEFSWSNELCVWEWQRIRHDKLTPNALSTTIACITSMRDAIQIEEIAEHAS